MEPLVLTLLLVVLLAVVGGGVGAFVGLVLFALRGAARVAPTRAADPSWSDDDEIAARFHH